MRCSETKGGLELKKKENEVQRQRKNMGFCLWQLSLVSQLIPKQRLTETMYDYAFHRNLVSSVSKRIGFL